MANPARREPEPENLHPSIDSDFRDSQYDAKNIFAANNNQAPKPFGVTNSAKVVRMSDYAPSTKKLPANQPNTRYRETKISTPANNNSKRLNRLVPTRKKSPVKLLKPSNLSPAVQLAKLARSFLTAMFALSWTFWLWLTVQLPFGILSLILLGLWAYSVESWWLEWFGKAVKTVLSWFGYEIDLFASFFFLSWMLVTIAGMIAVFGVLLQYLFSLYHPVSGRAAAIKMALLCAIIICYLTPFLNLFPWIWLYIFLLMRYPK